MQNYQAVLKRVGIVLILLAILSSLLYRSYRISVFGLVFILVGSFLVRGSLAAGRIAAWLVAFWITFNLVMLLFYLPTICSLDLYLTGFKTDPINYVAFLGGTFLYFSILAWIYFQLRSPVVLEARSALGSTTKPPIFGFILGVVLFLFSVDWD